MNAADTNVYVYAFDTDEPGKQARALALLDRLAADPAGAILLWQVAGEFLNILRRWQARSRFTDLGVEGIFATVCSQFAIRLPSAAVFALSFDLRRRFSLSHWDAMLLAACKDAGVTTLYSEDMAAGTDYDGLAVVNPFA